MTRLNKEDRRAKVYSIYERLQEYDVTVTLITTYTSLPPAIELEGRDNRLLGWVIVSTSKTELIDELTDANRYYYPHKDFSTDQVVEILVTRYNLKKRCNI